MNLSLKNTFLEKMKNLIKITVFSIWMVSFSVAESGLLVPSSGAGLGPAAAPLAAGLGLYGNNTAGMIPEKGEAGLFFTSHLGGLFGFQLLLVQPFKFKNKNLEASSGLNLLLAGSGDNDLRDSIGTQLASNPKKQLSGSTFGALKIKEFHFGLDLNNLLSAPREINSTEKFSFSLSTMYKRKIRFLDLIVSAALNNILAERSAQIFPFHFVDTLGIYKKINKLTSIGVAFGHRLYREFNQIGLGLIYENAAGVGSKARFPMKFFLSYQFTTQAEFLSPFYSGIKAGVELDFKYLKVSYSIENAGAAGLIQKTGIQTYLKFP